MNNSPTQIGARLAAWRSLPWSMSLLYWVSVSSLGSIPEASAHPLVVASSEVEGGVELKPVISYEQKVFSSSEAVELGERTLLDAQLNGKVGKGTQWGLRINTDPEKNPIDNETDVVEATLRHEYQAFRFAFDLNIDLDDNDRGATTVAIDEDSRKSFIRYQSMDFLAITLFPYNFGGEVGKQFKTDDVTRIFYVEGTPSYVNSTPLGDETIGMKTIPGVVLDYKWTQGSIYVGGGAASYTYPANADFDIKNQATSERWQVRNDTGTKFGFLWNIDLETSLNFDYVAHTKSKQTGALLASANSISVLHDQKGGMYWSFERVETKAGERPYKIRRDGKWFADQAPFYPIYADYYGKEHKWIGQTADAVDARFGYHFGSALPYFGYRQVGEHFIYRDRDSAHRLRTADDSFSHGGLKIVFLGVDWSDGALSVRPEVELKRARNKVFGNTKDLRQDRLLRQLGKEENAATLYITYGI